MKLTPSPSYYESEGIEQRRPELMPKTQAQGQPQPPPVYNDSDPVSDFRGAPASQSDLQLRPSPSAIAQTGYEPVGSQASPAPYRGEALPNPTGNLASGRENAGEPKQTSDPVIGHMGRLVSDDRQIAMFAGSSTGVHFISQAEQQLQMLRMHTETFPSSAYSMHLHDIWGTSTRPTGTTLAQSLTARLPTNATEILEATIDRWTPIYPIVHKPSMIEASRQLLSGGTVPDAVSTVLLYQLLALLALGTIGLSGGCVQDHYHFLCQSDGYYGMTTVLLDQILGKPCLQSLQGLEITQIYLQLTSRYSSALHLGGIATRLAQNLGLHRHSNRFKFDPLETELRRRVWWCQYSLDA